VKAGGGQAPARKEWRRGTRKHRRRSEIKKRTYQGIKQGNRQSHLGIHPASDAAFTLQVMAQSGRSDWASTCVCSASRERRMERRRFMAAYTLRLYQGTHDQSSMLASVHVHMHSIDSRSLNQ
jgi:hypothetical protein